MIGMKASETYKKMIKDISTLFKDRGFSRAHNCFYLQQGNNWGLMEFQKSGKSTPDEILFTINMGVCSGKLYEFFSSKSLVRKPTIQACQWRERIGFVLPDRQDKWWLIRSTDPLPPLMNELKDCLGRVGIPIIEQYLSDEKLCDEWSSGKSPGLTDIQRLVNLSVLLNASGAYSTLREVVRELEDKSAGRPTASLVRQHLKKLSAVRSGHGT